MIDVQQILSEELGLLQSEIILRHEQAGQIVSGRTKAMFENRLVSNRSGELLGAGYSGVLEVGRKPGRVPRGFVDILKRWVQAKGISFSNEKQFNVWANAVKWKIIREGTKLYRSGVHQDIFETPVEKFQQNIASRIAASVDEEITNQIFNQ